MIGDSKSIAERSARILIKTFFVFIKIITVLLFVVIVVLIASQTSVAPVSTRLLGSYGLEQAGKIIKPYRQYFPRPNSMEELELQEEK